MSARSTKLEEGSVPKWRPEEYFDSQVALDVIDYRNALSGAGGNDVRFLHLQLSIRTGRGREEFGAGVESFWRWIFDDSGAFPQGFWGPFL